MTIRTPGKFEGEADYAPHYYDLSLERGEAEEFTDNFDRTVFVFKVTPEAESVFKALKGKKKVAFIETESGFWTEVDVPAEAFEDERQKAEERADRFKGLDGNFVTFWPGEDMDKGVGQGDHSIRYGSQRDRSPSYKSVRTTGAIWFDPNYTSGSDYSGSLVEKTNFDVLVEKCNEIAQDEMKGDVSWFQTMHGGHGTFAILFHVERTPDEIVEMLGSLSDYPLLDESAHSHAEMEAADEAWENWAKSDYRRALEKKFGGEADEVDDEVLFEHFREAAEASNTYWENQQGSEMYIDIERIVKKVDEPPAGFKYEEEDDDTRLSG